MEHALTGRPTVLALGDSHALAGHAIELALDGGHGAARLEAARGIDLDLGGRLVGPALPAVVPAAAQRCPSSDILRQMVA